MKKIILSLALMLSFVSAQNITSINIDAEVSSGTTEDIFEVFDDTNETYPFISKFMVMGEFDTYTHKDNSHFNLEKPVCVVGYDDFSFQWLNQYKNELKESGAICLVTNIENEQQLNQLRSIDSELLFSATDVDWVPQFLKVNKYPVLITNEVVFQ